MPSTARGRSTWLAPLLLFLAVLLAAGLAFNVANLDTGGEAIPAPPNAGGTSTSPTSFDFASFSLYVVVALAIVTIVVSADAWRHRKRSRSEVRRPSSFWQFIQTIIGLAVFIALVVLYPDLARHIQSNGGQGSNTTAGGGSAPGGPMQVLQGFGGLPLGIFLATALLVAILILFYLHRLRGSEEFVGPDKKARRPERTVAAVAVQATIQDLEVGKDVRTTILACYQRFCRLLGKRGIDAQEPLTPREIQGLAVDRLGVAEERAEDLTSLFEEARYSVHELGEPERERALASLQSLRADLEA